MKIEEMGVAELAREDAVTVNGGSSLWEHVVAAYQTLVNYASGDFTPVSPGSV